LKQIHSVVLETRHADRHDLSLCVHALHFVQRHKNRFLEVNAYVKVQENFNPQSSE